MRKVIARKIKYYAIFKNFIYAAHFYYVQFCVQIHIHKKSERKIVDPVSVHLKIFTRSSSSSVMTSIIYDYKMKKYNKKAHEAEHVRHQMKWLWTLSWCRLRSTFLWKLLSHWTHANGLKLAKCFLWCVILFLFSILKERENENLWIYYDADGKIILLFFIRTYKFELCEKHFRQMVHL